MLCCGGKNKVADTCHHTIKTVQDTNIIQVRPWQTDGVQPIYGKYEAITFTKKTKPVKAKYKLHSTALEIVTSAKNFGLPPYPPDNYHCSDDVYLREGGWAQSNMCYMEGPDLPWEGAILVDRGAHCKV